MIYTLQMAENPLKVKYGDSLKDMKDFYEIVADESLMQGLFQANGVSAEALQDVSIDLQHQSYNSLGTPAAGSYSPSDSSLDIYLKPYWEIYHQNRILADQIASGDKKPHKKAFHPLLTTERLGGYLSNNNIDLKRRLSFADKLLVQGINKQLNITFMHEAKHLIDDKTDPAVARNHLLRVYSGLLGGAVFGWWLSGNVPNTEVFPIDLGKSLVMAGAYGFAGLSIMRRWMNPGEKRAEKFGNEGVKNLGTRKFLSFHPRLDWRSTSRWEY